ncbi:dihydrofolate reductase [uncultured Enterovirga sp.]|uniref:dihydrofolate reductase n=1 Tax=uncultured Enterovirga sp. TaxID=2026352 RepID=UPI0035CB39DD
MTAAVPLAIVVALAENGVIGRDNALPWRLRTDLRRFRDLTWGKPMIMGRRCWDAIGRPLPGRETVLMTRSRGVSPMGAHVASSWEEAKALASRLAAGMGSEEIAVVGGAEIYRLALPETDRLHLTRVHDETPGDVLFPAYDAGSFRETFRERHEAGEADEHAFTFIDLVRR